MSDSLDIIVAETPTGAVAMLPQDVYHSDMPVRGPMKKATRAARHGGSDAENKIRPWANWGDGNKLPTKIRKKIESVPLAGATVKRKIQMAYGNGLIYFRDSDVRDGDNVVARAIIPEVEDFIKRNKVSKVQLAILADYEYYGNYFTEMIWNMSRKADRKILEVYHKSAEHCRVARYNARTFRSEMIYYSPMFSSRSVPEDDQRRKMPLYQEEIHDLFLSKNKKKFAYHGKTYSPGDQYYASPFSISLFADQGWLDVSANVPRIIYAMQENQVCLKYHIKIPVSYFTQRYGADFWAAQDDAGKERREKIINAKIAELNENISGTDNLFKSISQVVKLDPVTGHAVDGIIIEAIDDKTKEGTWIPSSEKADAQIVQGLGMHPSQMGLQPAGGKMGAGSGSDQRESFNTISGLFMADDSVTLDWINLVSRINGWGVTFAYDRTLHTTINNREDGLIPGQATIVE